MRNALLVLALSVAASCAACMGTWEKYPTFERRTSLTLMVASNAAIVCDLSQTLWMAHGGRYDRGLIELNPVLGRTPSPGRIVATHIAALVANTATYFVLPKKWRPYYFIAAVTIEGANVLTQPSASDTMRYGQHKGCDFRQNWQDWRTTNPSAESLRTLRQP